MMKSPFLLLDLHIASTVVLTGHRYPSPFNPDVVDSHDGLSSSSHKLNQDQGND